MLLHGICDRTVPFSQSEAMYDALEEKGADGQLIGIEGADHADIQFFQRQIWDLITEFFKEKLV